MATHRNSYLKTVNAALVLTATAFVAGVCLVLPQLGLVALTPLAYFAAALCFVAAALLGWTAAGGLIALRRDTIEQLGKPYWTDAPRESQVGPLGRLRRRWLTLVSGSSARLGLRPGEWVQVRPYAEIARTLDAKGELDGLPFMPEMLAHCGRCVRVMRRIEKVHDYVHHTGLRRMRDAVLLERARCDGAAHGNCQAGCQFLWKEAWLKPAAAGQADALAAAAPEAAAVLMPHTSFKDPDSGELRYRCQMTQLPQATSPLGWGDPRHYLRDLWTGNVRFPLWVTSIALALFNAVQKRRKGLTAPYRAPSDRKNSPTEVLGLVAGERVRVKSKLEIEKTLTAGSRNRGLWFDVEMHRFCGGEYQVGARVTTMIEEATGLLLTLTNPCIVLEGVSATGEYLGLCPQNELVYWREIWLERVPASPGAERKA